MESERTQVHKGDIQVNDRVDLYVSANGLLLGVSRSFYEGRPDRYTQAFLFSDYRKTGDTGALLPYRAQLYIKGRLRQTYQVETYQFNVQTSQDLFISRRAQ